MIREKWITYYVNKYKYIMIYEELKILKLTLFFLYRLDITVNL